MDFHSIPSRALLLIPAVLLTLVRTPAHAQTAPDGRPTPAAAPSDTLAMGDLPDVVVTRSRLSLNLAEETRPIAVIRAEQIQALPHRSLADLLQTVAGVDVRQRGPAGVQADIGIRGGTFDQVLILLNGVRMNDPQTGHHAFSLPVDATAVERIEILKGAGARIYGQDAYAGVVNIITHRPQRTQAILSAARGAHGLSELSIHGSLGTSHTLTLQGRQSDGYRHNTDFRLLNAFYQGEWALRGGKFRLMAGQRDNRFGANGFYADERYRDQYEEVRTRMAALQMARVLSLGRSGRPAAWQTALSWRQNHDDYVFIRHSPEVYRNLHTSDVAGVESTLRIQGHQENPWVQETLVGVDFRGTWFTSTNLGNRERQAFTAFAERHASFAGDRLQLTTGAAIWTADDLDPVLLPGVDASWRGSGGHTIYTSWGLTSRVPTYTDLYYTDPVNLGNPDLRPERATSVEAGYRLVRDPERLGGVFRLQAGAFRRVSRNLIDWRRPDSESPWKPENLLRVATYGVETTLDWSSGRTAPPSGAGIRRASISHAWLRSDATAAQQGGTSRYALEHLRHHTTATMEIHLSRSTRLTTIFHAYDRANLPSYTLLHADLAWASDRFTLRLDGQNLLNASYRETNLVPMPGRWLKGGIELRF